MTMDEFVDATIDVWDIPAESATRVGHPAPFPVALPRRLIELYTYRGDLVLDPFMGSGSTAVAAVRTERHYVGFDTDEIYVKLAEDRAAAERLGSVSSAATRPARQRVTVSPGRTRPPAADTSSEEHAVTLGQRARELAYRALASSGFEDIERKVAYRGLGLTVDFRARDASGGLGLFELSGAYSTTRPGLRRPDVLWKALGKASVLHEARARDPRGDGLGPLILLSTDIPSPRSEGGRALRAVMGDDHSGPVFDVLELLDPECTERLRTYARATHLTG